MKVVELENGASFRENGMVVVRGKPKDVGVTQAVNGECGEGEERRAG